MSPSGKAPGFGPGIRGFESLHPSQAIIKTSHENGLFFVIMKCMKKVIIIGPAGAGKSTLAGELARKLGVEHTELDSINHQADWQPIEKDKFRHIVAEKTKQNGWVFCGNYFSTLGLEFWEKADAIIWLDYSFPLVLNRLLRRTFKRTLTKEELWNGNRESFFGNFFTSDSVILWMMKSWNKQKKRYEPIFKDPKILPKVQKIRLRSPSEAKAFLKSLEN